MAKTIIFVFGSNLAGRHGKGAALYAKEHFGAKHGVGEGRTGNAYALPTKNEHLRPLPLSYIQRHSVNRFLKYARAHTECHFSLTPVGCGLAGYKYSEIGPMFKGAPDNVEIPIEFRPFTDH